MSKLEKDTPRSVRLSVEFSLGAVIGLLAWLLPPDLMWTTIGWIAVAGLLSHVAWRLGGRYRWLRVVLLSGVAVGSFLGWRQGLRRLERSEVPANQVLQAARPPAERTSPALSTTPAPIQPTLFPTVPDSREERRPRVNVEANYFGDDEFAIIIRTPNNKEVIERLQIKFHIEGLITDIGPRTPIFNGEPCKTRITRFYSVDDEVVLHGVEATCEYIRPGALNGFVLRYTPANEPIPPLLQEEFGVVSVEMYWKFHGDTQIENFQVKKQRRDRA